MCPLTLVSFRAEQQSECHRKKTLRCDSRIGDYLRHAPCSELGHSSVFEVCNFGFSNTRNVNHQFLPIGDTNKNKASVNRLVFVLIIDEVWTQWPELLAIAFEMRCCSRYPIGVLVKYTTRMCRITYWTRGDKKAMEILRTDRTREENGAGFRCYSGGMNNENTKEDQEYSQMIEIINYQHVWTAPRCIQL